jgi:L-aminopeptidase/D-esterase-like protein
MPPSTRLAAPGSRSGSAWGWHAPARSHTHGSGEIFLGLANGLRRSGCGGPAISGNDLDDYFTATVDAAEEAVLSSMINAGSTTGHRARTLPGLPLDEVRAILSRYRTDRRGR